MANVMLNDAHLTAIANAIREKNNSSNTYKPSEMAPAISSLVVGTAPPDGYVRVDIATSALIWEGYCDSKCANDSWQGFFDMGLTPYITTKELWDTYQMFQGSSSVTSLPMDFNYDNIDRYRHSTQYMFSGCYVLEDIGKFVNFLPRNVEYMFENCRMLKALPELENCDWTYFQSAENLSNASARYIFNNCRALREVPAVWAKNLWNESASANSLWQYAFYRNHSLRKIEKLSPRGGADSLVDAMYGNFEDLSALSSFTFDVQDDGTPYSVNWQKQSLDLTKVGYETYSGSQCGQYLGYDKQVSDADTYAALKDDPDWWTTNVRWSRFNHDSAVELINSLPETRSIATVLTNNNTLRLPMYGGDNTDGGGMSNLTEAEIAIASDKGWNVSFVVV